MDNNARIWCFLFTDIIILGILVIHISNKYIVIGWEKLSPFIHPSPSRPVTLLQGRAVWLAHQTHYLKIVGSNPTSAIRVIVWCSFCITVKCLVKLRLRGKPTIRLLIVTTERRNSQIKILEHSIMNTKLTQCRMANHHAEIIRMTSIGI